MTAYSTQHGGFVIPNAGSAIVNNVAEPDAVDFNTVGNSRWGVVDGCDVAGGTGTVSVNTGLVLVNGSITRVTSVQTLSLSSSTNPRFDAVCVGADGIAVLITGTAGTNPVYPDISPDYTLLAVVYNESTIVNFDNYVIDKRNMLTPVFVSAQSGNTPIIDNVSSGTDTFMVRANGRIEWTNNDVALYRAAAGNLGVDGNLSVNNDLTVVSNISAGGDISASGNTTGSNLQVSTDEPSDPATDGTIFQTSASDGAAYIRHNGAWEQIATIENLLPVGTIIQSMKSTQGVGWLRLDGTVINEGSVYDSLFDVDGLSPFISGTTPTRTLALPNATGRVLLGAGHSYTDGLVGGAATTTLSLGNLPTHSHNVKLNSNGPHSHDVVVKDAGDHDHPVDLGGSHKHTITDPGHTHVPNGTDSKYQFALNSSHNKAAKTGSAGRLDSVHVDGSHANWIKMQTATASSQTGITETDGKGIHDHSIVVSGLHTHETTIASSTGTHDHNLSEDPVGLGTPVTNLPPYLTVYTHIRY
jgi:hypothetical protein